MNSLDAFVPLMALCSYAISLTPRFTEENPPWVTKLMEKGIHPEWVQLLKGSQLADFSKSNERLGAIIQPDCKWLNRIPNMIRGNVPLYFLWDYPSDFSHIKWLYDKYCPTSAEVREARLRAKQPSWGDILNAGSITHDQQNDDSTLVPDQQPPPSNEQFPKPDQFSGQRRGETMDDFFARRAARHAQIEATEKLDDRRSRLDRARAAENHHIPGRGGARCFVWEEIDGFMMRTYLVRSAVEDRWGCFANSQRRYDSFYNEWDLAAEFDPDARADDDDDDMILHPQTPPPPPYPPSPGPPQIFVNDISTTYRNNDSLYHNEAGDQKVQSGGQDALTKLLHWCFGYCWNGKSAYTGLPTASWLDIQKTLTDTVSFIDEFQ
jgi:hypothetical protein